MTSAAADRIDEILAAWSSRELSSFSKGKENSHLQMTDLAKSAQRCATKKTYEKKNESAQSPENSSRQHHFEHVDSLSDQRRFVIAAIHLSGRFLYETGVLVYHAVALFSLEYR